MRISTQYKYTVQDTYERECMRSMQLHNGRGTARDDKQQRARG